MKPKSQMKKFFELDDRIYHLEGSDLVPVIDLWEIKGDKWLVTDFKEGMSRLMTVDGPAKYADMLVRRKLQESGEFDEPVAILTHWKRRRGKNSTDIFFTAVPTRLARLYFEESQAHSSITLVFGIYGLLWQTVQHMAGKETVAVVLRHDRFAELVIASRKQVFFANRCVAFDTEPEQINTLWESVRADISAVENEHHVTVARTIHLSWVSACEDPPWAEEWLAKTVSLPAQDLMVDGQSQPITVPAADEFHSAFHSSSSLKEIACCYAKRWAPAVNAGMLAVMLIFTTGLLLCRFHSAGLERKLHDVRGQIRKVVAETAKLPMVSPQFPEQLQFIEDMARQHRQRSYQQIINDLSLPEFAGLQVQTLTVNYTPNQISVALRGDIEAPFDQAHGGYKRFLQRLERRGYRIEENRFETKISKSQVLLKLVRSTV